MASAHPISRRVPRERLLVLLFLAALAAPWVDELVRTDEARGPRQREHRIPAQKPGLTFDAQALYKYPSTYEAYFKDSFGLRDVLLRWHSLQSLRLFDVSPTDQVVLGKQGWYFFTGNDSVRTWRGLLPFSADELQQWKLGLEARRDWLRAQGISYLFVVAPNKETIYPDLYPDSITKLGPTRLEQLSGYMAQNSDVDFLDLTAAMTKARSEDGPQSHLYLEEGTHWNGRGSLVAYTEILTRLGRENPAIGPLPPGQWQWVTFDKLGDSWASNMYIGDLSQQRELGLKRPDGMERSHSLFESTVPFGPGRKYLRGTEDASQPRALLFHDSFGAYIENLLSEHFSRLECRWTYDFDSTAVVDFQPRIVIEMWVERALVFRDPRLLPPRQAEPADAAFAHAQTVCLLLEPESSPASVFEPLAKLQVDGTRDERGAAYRLLTDSAADSMLLPPLVGTPHGRPLVHLSIDSPRRSTLDILYLRPGVTEYGARHNLRVRLEQGPNDLYVRLPEEGVTGRLRLRPAHAIEGPYLLRWFEVRSDPGP